MKDVSLETEMEVSFNEFFEYRSVSKFMGCKHEDFKCDKFTMSSALAASAVI